MTVTRAWDFSAEISDREVMTNGDEGPVRSSDQAHTGSYSWKSTALTDGLAMGVPEGTSFIRVGWWQYAAYGATRGINGDLNFVYVHEQYTTNAPVLVIWMEDEERLDLSINGVIQDTIDLVDVDGWDVDVWMHMGLVCRASGAGSGFASFYFNGDKILSYSGPITGGGWDAALLNGRRQSYGYWVGGYADDGYVDILDGEADEAPPMYGFLPAYTLSAGEDAEYTPLSGSNYQMVDDGAIPDDDTTYNQVSTSGGAAKDTFDCSSIAVPDDYIIVAAHPFAVVRKLNAADDAQLKNTAWDGSTLAEGDAQNVPISYGICKSRMTTQPDGTSWNEDDFNDMGFGYKVAGSF